MRGARPPSECPRRIPRTSNETLTFCPFLTENITMLVEETSSVIGEEVTNMKCYVCAKEGKDSDAVGVCIVCGMGLCMKHAIREDTDIWQGGYPFPSKKLPKKIPRLLCPECSAGFKGA